MSTGQGELPRSLLLEEAAAPRALGDALARSVNERIPLVKAILDAGAASGEVVARHLARSDAPFLRQVAPALDVIDRLPPGLCERLLAVPVRLDAITGTVDVVVADASDRHPADEIGYHLRAPVRVVRAPLAAIEDALRQLRSLPARPPRVPTLPPAPPVPSVAPSSGGRIATPAWGTPIQVIGPTARAPTEPPKSGYGSEIPIPLTRKTAYPQPLGGSTQRPPALEPSAPDIPAPPPVPASLAGGLRAELAPDLGTVLAGLRSAASRDDVLELILEGARSVAPKVALFVVKKGGYLGWMGSVELKARAALKDVLVPVDTNSVFDRAVREELYLGPIPFDAVHAPLVRVLDNPTRDVAVVPVRVSGKTAVVIVADQLVDTMHGTRRLEELGRAAGDAFARIVRTRR